MRLSNTKVFGDLAKNKLINFKKMERTQARLQQVEKMREKKVEIVNVTKLFKRFAQEGQNTGKGTQYQRQEFLNIEET